MIFEDGKERKHGYMILLPNCSTDNSIDSIESVVFVLAKRLG